MMWLTLFPNVAYGKGYTPQKPGLSRTCPNAADGTGLMPLPVSSNLADGREPHTAEIRGLPDLP